MIGRAILLAIGMVGAASDGSLARSAQIAPLVQGTGTYSYPVAELSTDAQPYFDQGVRLMYGYRFPESIGSFREAQRRDPDSAMAFLGEALAISPNANSQYIRTPEDPARAGLAAAERAMARRETCSPKEQSMIEAVSRLYDYDGERNDRERYERYVVDLRELHERYPEDNEIATVFAGAIMFLSPWDYYRKDGSPRPLTGEARTALERVIKRSPQHPGANHYRIHLLENSKDPGEALSSAEILGDTMPGVGHVVHMPGHIYIRLGMYDRVMWVNRASVMASKEFVKQWEGYEWLNGISYPGSAQTHDMHAADFMTFTAVLMGNYEEAFRASRYSADDPRTQARLASGGAQARTAWAIMTDVRFREWDAVMDARKPGSDEGFALGIWHWARGMAFAASGNDGRAQEELASLDGVIENSGIEGLLVRANTATDLLDIADIHLTATLANNDGRTDEAELLLGQMVRKEDSLPYIEPLNWFTTARIELGALLLSKGRPDEAEIMFSQDLSLFPNNVWSLHGLWRSLEAQGKTGEANQAKQLFDVAMTKADVVFE